MKVTIKDIARLCDVSVTTVSRVINHKTDNIGAKTVERIEKKIAELGYTPSNVARSMITGRSHTVGLIIPDVRNPFFSELARGVEDYMNEHQYGVFLCNTDSSLEKEKQYIDLLKGRVSDGMLFTTQNRFEFSHYFHELIQNEYPIVLIERYLEGVDTFPGVYFDNRGGAKKICDFIISKGHKNIACITGPLETTNAKMRLDGYLDALKEAAIPYDESLVIHGTYRYQSGYDCMKTLLEQNERRGEDKKITAIFASNDMMAYGAYKVLEEAGLVVPRDISIAGFDNIKFPDIFKPKLTTVELPAYDMGKRAAEMLIRLMRKEELEEVTYEYPLEVVDKGSVGRV
ncbi:MAG: LacI family DNA-binding transcriptional regulator [Sphaerochaeta sp.]|nr:LacI family DNA-binding transcriptional regulator [Sphaerochaeta sp.]